MPATSIRDLVVKDDDLVIGTHGRSFWILDDIKLLRQISFRDHTKDVVLYRPQNAYRVRWDMNTDTPLPQEEPAGQNPPDGAIIDYYLKDKAQGEVFLEISDSTGGLVRRYSSSEKQYSIPPVNIPLYWVRPQQVLSTDPGSHRFLWDMHYTPLDIPVSFPMSAIYEDTPPRKTSPWVLPGTYTIRLIVDDMVYTQPMVVKMDPRVKTTARDLKSQFELSFMCYNERIQAREAMAEIDRFGEQMGELLPKALPELSAQLRGLQQQASDLRNGAQGGKGQNFSRTERSFATVFGILQGAPRYLSP